MIYKIRKDPPSYGQEIEFWLDQTDYGCVTLYARGGDKTQVVLKIENGEVITYGLCPQWAKDYEIKTTSLDRIKVN
jgi:hypothetical protein